MKSVVTIRFKRRQKLEDLFLQLNSPKALSSDSFLPTFVEKQSFDYNPFVEIDY